jgi:long-chain acyl-CoA synthetase
MVLSSTQTQPSTEARPVDSGRPLDAATVPGAFQRVVAAYPDKMALRTLGGAVSLTWAELATRVARLAAGLSTLGIGRGDTVAILLPNTIECHVLDFAANHLGAIPFAIFNSSPAEQIEHQLRVADATVVVTEQAFMPRLRPAVESLGRQVGHIVVVDGDMAGNGEVAGDETATVTLREVESAGLPEFDAEAAWRAVTADDLATLIFTSGTTGPPKAAQWTHRTVLAAQRAMAAVLPIPTDNLISFLPMAHAGGRVTVHYMALVHGATITVCPDMSLLPQHLAEVHPDAFFSVPRLWEKLQVAIEATIAGIPSEAERRRTARAVEAGLRRVTAQEAGTAPAGSGQADADLEVLRPILARLGLDQIKAAFIGGAPSSPEIVRFFRAVGVPLLEAYGLTEGSLNVFNRVEEFKAGTSGRALPGVELALASDGELLARGDLNFVGYRKQPEETAATLDPDGWLHTGDIAQIDGDGYVTVVDRKKEIIINAAGKNMSPAAIENAVKGESSLIGQVVAIGDRRRYVVALITLDPEALGVFARRQSTDGASPAELVASPQLRDEIAAAVERANTHLHGNEQVKKFALIPTAWLPDSDELTPTAKLKRRAIHQKYAAHIEDLYTDHP